MASKIIKKQKVNMKKIAMMLLFALAVTGASAQDVMKKQSDGTYVVNTTTLGKDVKGYEGATPVEVYIKKDKIVKVVPLSNNETPKHFAKVKRDYLPKFEGVSVKKFAETKVDAVTGATISSNSILENVRLGVEYYKKHK